MQTRWIRRLGISALVGLGTMATWGCGDSVGTMTQSVTLAGAVQKGPFVLGSTVNVSTLDAKGNPLGQVFNTKTSSDLGEFQVDFTASGQVSLEGSGFYYNEVSGGLSTASITLRAYYEITAGGKQEAYVNLVTHLTYDRIKRLVADGATFAAATKQAEDELRTALGVGGSSFVPGKAGIDMNILGGDTDANDYLFAVSALVAQAAATKATLGAGSVDAVLQELLNTTAADLADDGKLTAALATTYQQAQLALQPEDIMNKLRARLSAIGSTASIPDLNRIIDTDGDGIPNAKDNCLLIANPMQDVIKDGLCRIVKTNSVSIPEGTVSATILAGDLDHSGTTSVVAFVNPAASTDAAVARVFAQSATGRLQTPRDIRLPLAAGFTSSANQAFVIDDVSKDGEKDIILSSGTWMAVYPTDGKGGFGAPGALTQNPPQMIGGFPFTGYAGPIAVGDFDGNGLPDIAGTPFHPFGTGITLNPVVLQLQTAAGVWAAPKVVSMLSSPMAGNIPTVAAADLNHDNKPDLVTVNYDVLPNPPFVAVLLGDGAGGFAAMPSIPLSQGGSPVVVDVNSDTLQDVLIQNTVSGGGSPLFLQLLGDGTGKLAAPTTAVAGSIGIAGSVFVGNFTKDSLVDIMTPGNISSPFLFLSGTGTGFKAQPTKIANLSRSGQGTAVDLNKDGVLDFVDNDGLTLSTILINP
ncbi:MAG TPA: hypothetical protein DCE44_22100 [Verrucomicrobiales bacterium]|nr:hypothetical protein [Verrucomicrobiales bacterium]